MAAILLIMMSLVDASLEATILLSAQEILSRRERKETCLRVTLGVDERAIYEGESRGDDGGGKRRRVETRQGARRVKASSISGRSGGPGLPILPKLAGCKPRR